MPEGDTNHVTRDELKAELKALNYRMVLWMTAIAGLIKFDLPTSLTITAVALGVAKCAWALLVRA